MLVLEPEFFHFSVQKQELNMSMRLVGSLLFMFSFRCYGDLDHIEAILVDTSFVYSILTVKHCLPQRHTFLYSLVS